MAAQRTCILAAIETAAAMETIAVENAQKGGALF
jgi:hypothetical protein